MTNVIMSKPEKRLLLIDGHAVAFHSWFSNYPHRVVPGFFKMLRACMKRHLPTHLIVTFDPPPPTFRHQLYPEYKANRPPAPLGLLEDCERLRERLGQLSVVSSTIDGYEADDVLGTLASKAAASGFTTTILTSDYDLLQVVSPATEVALLSQYWNRMTFDVTAVRKKFSGLAPENIPDYKALVGDKSDNLPGVPGIGAVSTTVMLGHYGNLDDLYENLGSISNMSLRGTKRVIRLLMEHQEQAFLMRTLATIVCDVPVDFPIDKALVNNPDSLAM